MRVNYLIVSHSLPCLTFTLPQLARQLVGAELQQIVYRLLVTSSNCTNYLRREYLPVVLGQSALGDLDSTETVDVFRHFENEMMKNTIQV